jgi:hypothetical protein
MPYTFSFDPVSRVAWVFGSGPMDLAEALSAPQRLFAHADYRPGFGVLVDLREMEYEPAAGDVMAVARNLVKLRPLFQHRLAVVVRRSHSVAAELVAAIATASGFPLRIFASVEEARRWVCPEAGSEKEI